MRFYLTTAIDYVNSRPHLGTAYEKVTADVIARYKRLAGADVHFLMGNDEHSQNVFRKAREAGEDPVAYCDRMEHTFREVWAKLAVSYDDFIRTTQPRHRAGVQKLFQACQDRGDVYEGHYEGWYCVGCEAFKQEKDLENGLCPIHKTRPDWIREKNYFFRLSHYRDRLRRHFADHPTFLQPDSRRNEILRLLEEGLEDVSVSRAGQAWGIPLPSDPSSVVYVWFDALINYASAVGYGTDEGMFAKWWPADLHVIGKDITRFHTVVWPAMLMSAGLELPRQVFGHGWVTLKGERMSKSLGTAVDPLEAADHLGPDPLRLYLVKEVPYGGDGDFSWDRFEEKYNVDLANNLGNLVNRVTTMAERYRGGELRPTPLGSGRLATVAQESLAAYAQAMERFALHEGVASAYRLIDATNEFIAETEPWAIARSDAGGERLGQVLFDAAEALRVAAVLLLPVMPASCAQILSRAGETVSPGALVLDRDAAWKSGFTRRLTRDAALWPRLESRPAADASAAPVRITPQETPVSDPSQTPVPAPAAAPAPVAPATPPPAGAPAPAPATDKIAIDDFMKVELRVATVLAAERVPKSKKLIKMQVDLGTEQRQILAGIAEAYEPEALVGRSIVIVANLKPAVLMGLESNGMVLAASPDGGKPELVSFVTPPPPGSRVR